MLSSTGRIAARRILTVRPPTARRLLSTAPPAQRSRSWKSSAARWGLAIGGIWYYNTTSVFAEEPELATQHASPALHLVPDSSLPTIDAVVEEKRARQAQVAQQSQVAQQPQVAHEGSTSVEDLEDEADQQGAFNPETGEINWDCPCLGGMAHGPCGPEFKEAFSCFVFSKEEPKGMDCIDKFKGMQDCFRQHPEHYGEELADEEEVELEEGEFEEAGDAGKEGVAAAARDARGETPAAAKAVEAAPPVVDGVVPKDAKPSSN